MKSSSVIIAIVIFAIGCNSPETEHLEAKSVDLGGWILENVVPQKSVDRVFREITIESTARTGNPDSLVLFRPGAVFGDENGFSYVVDYGDILIKKFDVKGNLVGVIGNGRGDGPGEMQNPIGFQEVAGGLIMILDPNPRKMNYFKSDGSFAFSRTHNELYLRFAQTPSGLTYFVSRPRQLTSFFSVVRDTTIIRFPSFSDNPLPTTLHLDGRMIAVGEDMVYVPFYYGLLIRYNEVGEQIYARETIGRRDIGAPTLEKIERPGWPANYRVTGRPDYARSITTDNNRLFIHGRNTNDSLDTATVIDVYRAEDGEYEYSFSIPHRARQAKKYGPYVYSLMDTTVVISKIRIKEL